MENFKNINKILSNKYKKKLLFIFILMLSASVFELISLNLMYQTLSYFSDTKTLSKELFEIIEKLPKFYTIENYLIIIFFLAFFVKTILYLVYFNKQTYFKAHCVRDISSRLFEGYINLPKLFHLRSNSSEIIKNITVEASNFNGVLEALTSIVLELIVLIFIVTFLFSLHPIFVVLTFIFLLLVTIFFHKINIQPITQMGKDRIKYERDRLKHAYDGISGNKTYEMTNTKGFIKEKFLELNLKLAIINRSIDLRRQITKPVYEILIIFLLAVLLIHYLSENQTLKSIVPELGVFLMAAYRLIPSFIRIIHGLQKFGFLIQPVEKLKQDFENFKNFKKNFKYSDPNFKFNKTIILKDIIFSYKKKIEMNNSENILNNLNLRINCGDKIGIVGQSGVGKSTLLDIIMGLLPTNSGKVLVDERNIDEIKQGWQKCIGCVPQDVYILDESIRKNIAFGIKEDQIDENKIQKAIKLSNLEEFCQESKFGLNTLIGKNGSRISGGQKQRIGIARALYNNPEVLIFDEATSALDEITEKKIIDEIKNNFEKKTIILVSHKAENLRHCNKIFEIKKKTLSQIK